MRGMRSRTTLISVVVAVVLFLIANHFDTREPWQPGPERDLSFKPAGSPSLAGPVQTLWSASDCDRAEQDVFAAVESAQHCETDEDCTVFDWGYPIQCLTAVNAGDIPALRQTYSVYQANCNYRVYYDCPTGNHERVAACRNARCVVELQSPDRLTEETLRQLSIER
ncbi:MAG: hypothetical protein ACREQZ_11610 [Woeseiaceae bacterium]